MLVDAGLSCRETEKRLRRMGLNMGKIKAIFISHEHGDHIKGIQNIAFKHQVPVYITAATLHSGRLHIQEHLVRHFSAHEPVAVGSLTVTAFPKLHDAADPHSFVISGNGVNVGVLTDIGEACEQVHTYFNKCHAAFLEANYDDAMLEQGRYPYHLKKRISGSYGHLSNQQALDLFLAHRATGMSHVFLSHLSKDNNDPDLAAALFSAHAGKTKVVVASRYTESEVYEVRAAEPVSYFARRAIQVEMF